MLLGSHLLVLELLLIERLRRKIETLLAEESIRSLKLFEHDKSNECGLLREVLALFPVCVEEEQQAAAAQLRRLRGQGRE